MLNFYSILLYYVRDVHLGIHEMCILACMRCTSWYVQHAHLVHTKIPIPKKHRLLEKKRIKARGQIIYIYKDQVNLHSNEDENVLQLLLCSKNCHFII